MKGGGSGAPLWPLVLPSTPGFSPGSPDLPFAGLPSLPRPPSALSTSAAARLPASPLATVPVIPDWTREIRIRRSGGNGFEHWLTHEGKGEGRLPSSCFFLFGTADMESVEHFTSEAKAPCRERNYLSRFTWQKITHIRRTRFCVMIVWKNTFAQCRISQPTFPNEKHLLVKV